LNQHRAAPVAKKKIKLKIPAAGEYRKRASKGNPEKMIMADKDRGSRIIHKDRGL
jgi:hypothetical protein